MAQIENKISLDPRISISDYPTQFTEVGASQVQYRHIPATTASPNNFQWNGIIAPQKVLVGRTLIVEYTATVTIPDAGAHPCRMAGFSAAAGVYDGIVNNGTLAVNCGFRSNPLHRVCTTLDLQLNNSRFSVNPQQYMNTIGPYVYTNEQRKKLASLFPSMLDKAPALGSDAVQTNLTGSSNPLSFYCNSDGTSRASFYPVSYTLNAGVATYVFKIYEPLLISPLSAGLVNEVALGNIQSFSINMLFDTSNQLTNMLEINGDPGVVVVTSVALSAPTLHIEYFTVNPDIVNVPDVCTYTYENLIPAVSACLAPVAAEQTATSNSLKLTTMPKLVYGSINPVASSRAVNVADTGATITGLKVIWGSQGSSFLAEMDSLDIWRMTCRNTGSDITFAQWKLAGYGFCFDPVRDFGATLQSGYGGEAGSSLMFQMDVKYSGANYVQSGAGVPAVQWYLNILAVNQGNVMISENMAQPNIAVVSQNELLVALEEGAISTEIMQPTVEGGSLFSSLKNVFHKAHHIVKKGAQALQSEPVQAGLKYLAGSGLTGGRIVQTPRKKH